MFETHPPLDASPLGARFEHSAALAARRRPFFWLALAFCAGIAGDATGRPDLLAWPCVLGVVSLLGAAGLAVLRRRVTGPGLFLCSLLVALTGGMLVHACRARLPAPDDLSLLLPSQPAFAMLRGTVVDASRGRAPSARDTWTLDVDALGADEFSLRPASGRVRLAAPDVSAAGDALSGIVGEGDLLQVRARLEPLPEATLPDSFDYGAYLRGQGLRRLGAVFPGSVHLVSGPRWWRADLVLRRASTMLAEKVEAVLPDAGLADRGAGSQAALLNALLFGRRERLDLSDKEAFIVTGAAHLLAISGLQIQFLAVMLWWLCGLLGAPRRASAWLVLFCSCAYCALAGADPPILRATVMIVLYMGALLSWREPDALTVLAAAALLILAVSPGELFNPGFQLSFLAVLALVTVYPALDEAWQRRAACASSTVPGALPLDPWQKPWRPLRLYRLSEATRTALLVSLAAWFGTAPVIAWHMGRFTTYSLCVNLVAVPLNSFCMVLGLVMLAATGVSSALGAALGWAASGSLALLQWLNAVAAEAPGASLDVPAPAVPLLLVYALVWLWAWVALRRGVAFWRLTAVLAAALLLLACVPLQGRPAEPGLVVLDLKYGRAALVETPAGAALIDAGAPGDSLTLAELLRRRGTRRLELLVISADEPETIGGALALLKRVPTARVVLPRAAAASAARRELEDYLGRTGTPYGTPEQLCGADLAGLSAGGDVETVVVGEARAAFWDDGPPPDQPAAPATTLCVRVTLCGTTAFFVTARSDAALRRLLAKAGRAAGDPLKADILRLVAVGGHWPGATSDLVARMDPCVLVTGGRAHPQEGVDLDALTEAHAGAGKHRLLVSLPRDGTLRVLCGGRTGSPFALQILRNGIWRHLRSGRDRVE